MRAIVIHVYNDRGQWTETYMEGERGSFTESDTDLDKWAVALVEWFNQTLSPGQLPRTLVRVEHLTIELDTTPILRVHEWKKTNLVTLYKRGRYYDTAICVNCRATGKRYGVSEPTLDKRFEKLTICPGKK